MSDIIYLIIYPLPYTLLFSQISFTFARKYETRAKEIDFTEVLASVDPIYSSLISITLARKYEMRVKEID